jgi:hypothetical protein
MTGCRPVVIGVILTIASMPAFAGCMSAPPPDSVGPVTSSPRSVAPPTQQPTTPPAIDRPLDISAYRDKICEILPDPQAQALGFPGSGEPRVSASASRCYRVTADPPTNLSLYYAPRDLLGEAYRSPLAIADFFNPKIIVGQPAVEMGSHDALRERVLFCSVVIGFTATDGLEIGVDDTSDGKACERATSVGEAIVHNLGG